MTRIVRRLGRSSGSAMTGQFDIEELFLRYVLREHTDRPAGGPVAETEGVEDSLRDERRIQEIGQLDDPGAIGESSDQVGRHSQGQACLACTTRTGQGEQSGRLGLRSLPAPPDKARQLSWKVVRPTCGSAVSLRHPGPSRHTP